MMVWDEHCVRIEGKRTALTKRKKLAIKPGELAIVCDGCTGLISGDEGFLTVVPGHNGMRRWRAYHDNCGLRAKNPDVVRSLAGYACAQGKSVVVRTGAVATYTELLATLAELARCPELDFAQTAWPALLQRLAFDTDWELTDGRAVKQLERENTALLLAGGLSQPRGVIVGASDPAETIARRDRRVRQTEREAAMANEIQIEEEIAG